jgi:hypothetical protein
VAIVLQCSAEGCSETLELNTGDPSVWFVVEAIGPGGSCRREFCSTGHVDLELVEAGLPVVTVPEPPGEEE